MTPISSAPPSLSGPHIPHHATFYHSYPPVHPRRRKHPENDHPPRSKNNTAMHKLLHRNKHEPKPEVIAPAPAKDMEHLFVRPLTPRDLDTCLRQPGTKSDRDSVSYRSASILPGPPLTGITARETATCLLTDIAGRIYL